MRRETAVTLLMAFFVIALSAAGCASKAPYTGSAGDLGPASPLVDETTPVPAGMDSVLPALPVDHGASELTETLLNGSETFEQSDGALATGTELTLASEPGSVEWAVYRFNPNTTALDSVSVLFSATEGSSAWIGLSDYAKGSWSFSGPYTKSKTLALDDGQYLSTSDNIYIVITACNGSSVTVQALSLRTIHPANQPPLCYLEVNHNRGYPPLLVYFDASASHDPDGEIRYFLWDFDGDGGYDRTTFVNETTFTYNSVGVYTASVVAVDNYGAYGIDGASVIVDPIINEPPVASWSVSPKYGYENLSVTLNAGNSRDDDGEIVKYEWDFDGDGLFDSYGELSIAVHIYAPIGVYHPKLRITDNDCGQDEISAEVRVNEDFSSLGAWPMVGQNPRRTSCSPYSGAWTNLTKWTFASDGWCIEGPTIGPDGTIYIGGSTLYALKPDGSLRWSKDFYSWAPTVGPDDVLYCAGSDCLRALDINGDEIWAYPTTSPVSNPVVGEDGAIYFVSWEECTVTAVTSEGQFLWVYDLFSNHLESAPAIGRDGTIYVCGDSRLAAIQPDGEEKWDYQAGSFVRFGPAIGVEDTIYFGSEDYNLYAVNPEGDLVWKYTTDDCFVSCPAIGLDGTIFISCASGYLHAVNPDGSPKWQQWAWVQFNDTPAVDRDGCVYVGSGQNVLTAFRPNGSPWWEKTLSVGVGHPVIGGDGTVYVGDTTNSHWPEDTFVYAIWP